MAETPNRGYDLPEVLDQRVSFFKLVSALTEIDADIALLISAVMVRAAINSPEFTGEPRAPTQSVGDSSTKLATTAFVQAALEVFAPPSINADAIDSGTLDDERLSFAISAFAKSLLDDNDPAAARATLGISGAISTAVDAAVAGLRNGVDGAYDTLAEIATALANKVAKNADTVLAGGYWQNSYVDDGTKSSGTYTPSPAGGNVRFIVNGGAFTIAAPTSWNAYTMVVGIQNNASAGAITLTGFHRVTGDDFTQTNTHSWAVFITRLGFLVFAHVVAMQ